MNDNMNNNSNPFIPPFYRNRPHIIHEGRYFLLDDDGNVIPEEIHHISVTRSEVQKYRHHE